MQPTQAFLHHSTINLQTLAFVKKINPSLNPYKQTTSNKTNSLKHQNIAIMIKMQYF